MALTYLVLNSAAERERLSACLRSGSLSVRVFADDLEAYQAIHKLVPDLLIADTLGTTVGGLALARLLKFNDRYRALRVLLLCDTEQDSVAAAASGADGHLIHPIGEEALLQEARRLLALAPASADSGSTVG